MRKIMLFALAVFCGPLPAAAHVVATPSEVKAASYTAVAFRVGHACSAGDVTLKVRVEVPDNLGSARPQAKPGWSLDIERTDDPDPAKRRVTAVTWSGRLPDDQFDDFSLLMKLPNEPGALVFPVIQTCAAEESQWTQVADPARPGEKLDRPAPLLRVLPADAVPVPVHSH